MLSACLQTVICEIAATYLAPCFLQVRDLSQFEQLPDQVQEMVRDEIRISFDTSWKTILQLVLGGEGQIVHD